MVHRAWGLVKMPPSKREYLKRRCRQADNSLRRAQQYLATIYSTVHEQHRELTPVLLALLGQIDGIRRANRVYYLNVFGGTERDLWVEGDLDIILEEAKPISTPRGGWQNSGRDEEVF